MTKTEFEKKFNTAYSSALNQYVNGNALKHAIAEYSDKDGKISSENLAMFAFTESIRFTGQFLKSLLEDVLEFD